MKQVTAEKFIIAVGGRPKYPGIPGDKECCITSDDIFSLDHPPARACLGGFSGCALSAPREDPSLSPPHAETPSPPHPQGKTLCIGASYIALETAGFLTACGFPTTVMARSVFLRGFDTEIASAIVEHMERHGTKFLREVVPTKFEKTADGKVKVTYKSTNLGFEAEAVFDTVVLAVGRDACTGDLGLDKAGVATAPGGKIPVIDEQTNAPHIFAIGDVLESRQELTPVAIKAGVRLARRLYGGGTLKMDYDEVPTTVFTPLEYGCVGLSEEAAIAKYGADAVEVYILYNTPLVRSASSSFFLKFLLLRSAAPASGAFSQPRRALRARCALGTVARLTRGLAGPAASCAGVGVQPPGGARGGAAPRGERVLLQGEAAALLTLRSPLRCSPALRRAQSMPDAALSSVPPPPTLCR